MKNRISTFITFCLLLTFLFGQERTVYQTRHWHPKSLKSKSMETAISTKTKKYNVGNDNYPMYSFRVITGKNQGAILRVSPRKSFADRDKYPTRKSEIDYWQKYVIPYVDMSKDEGTGLWLEMEDHSYNGSGNTDRLRYRKVTEYLIRPAKMREWIELRNKLVEAHIETNSKARFRHFNRISGGKTHLIHMVVPFDSWEDYGNLVPIFSAKIFNDAHGDGEHKKWLDQISNIIEYRKAFIREYLPELSTN